ncbi:MAG: acyltransferase [Chlorobiaceae bacterium]|nr:acyltransferase [Chlorobiaceae bacterium]
MTPKYRPDIDGLRAIAVLAVLFFHTEVPGFTGGFVGVDVFFVISGYLITTIIVKDIKSDSFSFSGFYERRIRRIFPALFSVMAFVLAAGAFLLDRNAFRDLGTNIWATTLFSANILYWQQAGYFEASSLLKPLLHTWSLAVEEQFYIVFPILLMAVAKYLKGNYRLWTIATFLLSLGISIYGVSYDKVAAYYLMPYRAWELLTGSVIALGIVPVVQAKWQKELLSFAGLAFIGGSIYFYSNATPFPGVAALLPVVGAGLVIYGGQGEGRGMTGKILSARPLTFIGLISYSLYLWHWPFVAYTRYVLSRPFETQERLSIIGASLVFAILSWKFVEQPFRGSQPLFSSRKRLFTAALAVMAAAVFLGGLIDVQNGLKWRYPGANAGMEQAVWDWYPSSPVYGNLEQLPDHPEPGRCGKESEPGSFLLWGDSHAMALVPGLDSAARRHGVSGYLLTHSQCPPLLDYDVMTTGYNEPLFNSNVLRFLNGKPEVRTVILAGAWHSYWFQREREFERKLAGTIDALRKMKKNVVLVTDIPYIGDYESPRPIFLSRRFPAWYRLEERMYIPERENYDDFNGEINGIISRVVSVREGVAIVHPENMLFDREGRCIILNGEQPLYRNDSHLSTEGSLFIAPVFDKVFSRLASDAAVRVKRPG